MVNNFGKDFIKACKKAGIKVTKSTYTPTPEQKKMDRIRAKEISAFLKKIDRAEKSSRKSKLKFP